MTTCYSFHSSPLGSLLFVGDERRLTGLHFREGRTKTSIEGWVKSDERFAGEKRQLDRYLRGDLKTFDIEVRPAGTPFQERVWAELCEIPFGQTISYGELALRSGHKGWARAVGSAVGRNPIAIVVPCHRVVGKDGTLTGYGGGLDRKKRLLDLELLATPIS